MLTSTHVIALYTYGGTHVLAFTVDESAVRSGEELCLSHKGISDRFYQSVTLLQNSVVDPVTGSIKMKLLDYVPDHFACDSLTLPKQSGDDVLPISVVDKQIAKIEELLYLVPDTNQVSDCQMHAATLLNSLLAVWGEVFQIGRAHV